MPVSLNEFMYYVSETIFRRKRLIPRNLICLTLDDFIRASETANVVRTNTINRRLLYGVHRQIWIFIRVPGRDRCNSVGRIPTCRSGARPRPCKGRIVNLFADFSLTGTESGSR